MRALELITGHVTFKLRYNQIYQMKTTFMYLTWFKFFQLKKKKIAYKISSAVWMM